MGVALIVLAVLVVGAIVAGLALNPVLAKKGDEAIATAKRELGEGNVLEIEPKAVGLATDPPEAGTNGGQGVLAVSATDLVFVTWGKQEVMKLSRADITSIECSADRPGEVSKATIIVTFPFEGKPAKAQFRLGRDLVNWLDVLGYDWGPEGKPEVVVDADADD